MGFSLTLTFLRAQLNYFFGVVLSSCFLLAGGVLGLIAPTIFFQVPVAHKRILLSLMVGIGGLLAYVVLGYSIAFAMVGVCFGMSILLVSAGALVLKEARRPLAMPARIFAWSMGLMGVAYWVRAALVAWNPNVGVAPVSLAGGHQSMLIWGALFVVSSTISFYSMVHDEQKHEIAERAKRDSLTGLFNRRAFFDLAAQIEQKHEKFSILMIDIDHFKAINDTYGHAVGDDVLRTVAQTIEATIRRSDVVGRIGGEEFSVFLPNTEVAGAQQLAETLRREIEKTQIEIDGVLLKVTASIGVATKSLEQETMQAIQQHADQAMYEAKRGGRNRVSTFVADVAPTSASPA